MAALSGKSSKVKADHRPLVAQPERRRAEVTRQAVADARAQCRRFGFRSHLSHPVSGLFLVKGARAAFGKEIEPVAEHHGGGRSRCNVFPKGALGQFGAQRRPAFGSARAPQRPPASVRSRSRNSRREGPDSCRARPRESGRYVAKIFALQRQRLVFGVALEENELAAEILGEAVDAASRRMRQQLIAIRGQVVGAQFVEARMRDLEGRREAIASASAARRRCSHRCRSISFRAGLRSMPSRCSTAAWAARHDQIVERVLSFRPVDNVGEFAPERLVVQVVRRWARRR